jgi:hypothetical protein
LKWCRLLIYLFLFSNVVSNVMVPQFLNNWKGSGW